MRKFIIYTREIPGHCKASSEVPAIIEVEGEKLTPQEDGSVLWIPEPEFKFRITKPDFLQDVRETVKSDGSKVRVVSSLIYYSHSIYWNKYQARIAAEKFVRDGFEFTKRKTGKDFTEEEVKAKFAEITEIML